MDTWAFIIIAAGIVGYFALKRRPVFLFVTGFGVGLLTGAIWASVIINQVLR